MNVPHELNVEDGKVALAYAGPVKPWHSLGTQVPGAMTAEEALVAGRLDWNVNVVPLKTETNAPVPGHFATVREDSGSVLGIVKGRYTVCQNSELASFLGDLFGKASAVIDTVGALRKGSPVWFLAKTPNTMEIKPGDPVETMFLATSSHDGTGAITLAFCSTRVICANTLGAALRNARHKVSIRHTKNVRVGLGLAASILAKSETYWTRFREACQVMAKQDVNRDEVRSFLERMFPGKLDEKTGTVIDTPSVLAARSRVLALFDGAGDGASLAGSNRWGLLNAATQFIDRDRPIRGKNTNRWLSSNFGGAGENLRQRAFDLLVAPSLV
jgi:phage/plasmid-like protein (TIGR03299 family)